MSDRLFALLKNHFTTDNGTRVNRLHATFSELFNNVDKGLSKCPEVRLFEYDLANWDFEKWLEGMNADTSDGAHTTLGP